MTRARKDVGASVRARLLRLARERGDDFQLLLTRFANERFLYRLSESAHQSSFVLKGATLFAVWTGEPHRATRDVDLLGFGEPSEDRIRSIFDTLIASDVDDDGVVFERTSLEVGPIREGEEYGGVRAQLVGRIAGAKVRLQIDVGFGDAVIPAPVATRLPTLLDFPAPELRVYPPEAVVAEKLEAMVALGLANSRMKDFYDIVVLAQTFGFDGSLLVRANRATFERRVTTVPTELPTALTAEFYEDAGKNVQWSAFVRKSGAKDLGGLEEVVGAIAAFVAAPLDAARSGAAFDQQWDRGGGWSEGELQERDIP